MNIEYVAIDIFHRKDTIKIETGTHCENYYNLGTKEADDNFKIEFKSISDQKFLVLHEDKDGHYEHIEENSEGKVLTKISMHRKLILVIKMHEDIAIKYQLEIKHENHQSLFCFSIIKQMKFFLHSNGLPDSKEIDRHKNHFLISMIFSIMDESKLTKIAST